MHLYNLYRAVERKIYNQMRKEKMFFLLNVVRIVFKTRVFQTRTAPGVQLRCMLKISHKRSRLLMTIISFFINLKFQESFKHLAMEI